jgi:hypothetical protein
MSEDKGEVVGDAVGSGGNLFHKSQRGHGRDKPQNLMDGDTRVPHHEEPSVTGSSYVSLRLPTDLLQTVQRRAEIEDRSLSAVVRQSLRQYVGDDQDERQQVTRDRQTA